MYTRQQLKQRRKWKSLLPASYSSAMVTRRQQRIKLNQVQDPRRIEAINLIFTQPVKNYPHLLVEYTKANDIVTMATLLAAAQYSNVDIVTQEALQAAEGQAAEGKGAGKALLQRHANDNN